MILVRSVDIQSPWETKTLYLEGLYQQFANKIKFIQEKNCLILYVSGREVEDAMHTLWGCEVMTGSVVQRFRMGEQVRCFLGKGG